jgi:PAS domain S-box-containing protein
VIATKIVAVEDERIVALHLKQQLTNLGYEVPAIAASGETALETIHRLRPDLVLMDIHIEGDIDGIETAARIPAEFGIPVIYLTAFSEDVTLERARATKPYGYLIKPYSERELHATIQMALERRQVEVALQASEDRFRSIFGAVSEGIFIADAETGAFMEVNEPGGAMFGYAAEDLIGQGLQAISSGEPPYTQSQALDWREKAAVSGEPQRFDWRGRTKDGRLLWVDISLRVAVIGGRRLALAIVRDLTERRGMEEQLRQAQKMEAIGQLTGGIAHDFNNLLGVIIGNLDLLRGLRWEDDELIELSGDALDAALGGADLTRRLLAFARRQPLQPQRIDLKVLVSGTVKLLRRVLGEDISIALDLAADTGAVLADPAQLESALTNLATNARDAMPAGGRLMIATRRARLDEAYAAAHQDVTPGDYAMIEVTDTGEGMGAEVMSRIFEPFYTTKAGDHGTGLGLSMVFGFLKQSGGHVSVYSEPAVGTTFRLYLPRIAEADPSKAAVPPATPSQGRGEMVLVVEDNDSLRRVAVRELRTLGYQVIEAPGGAEALSILDAVKIDLLFTDVVLPGGIDGLDLARQGIERRPDLKVLLTSGFPQTKLADKFQPSDFRLLTKPYRRSDLARTLREVLDGSEADQAGRFPLRRPGSAARRSRVKPAAHPTDSD